MRNIRTRRECALARLRRAAPLAALSYSVPLALRTARSSRTCTALARGALEIPPLCFPHTTRWHMAAPTNRLRAPRAAALPRARCGQPAVTRGARQAWSGCALPLLHGRARFFVHALRCSSATAASCTSRGFRLSVHTLYCCAHAKNPSPLNGSRIALFYYLRYTQRHRRVSQAPKAVALGIRPHYHRVFARCAQINGTTVKHKARTPGLCARGRSVWRSSRSSKARGARYSGRGRGCCRTLLQALPENLPLL